MKVILFTSSITYTLDNYHDVLRDLILNYKKGEVGVVLVKQSVLSATLSILRLFALRCPRLGTAMLKNFFRELFRSKERMLKDLGVEVYVTDSLNSVETLKWVANKSPLLLCSLRSRSIFSAEMLSIPNIVSINLHHGLLPKYRGLFCDLRDLAEQRESGFSVHVMEEEIDSGAILHVERVMCKEKKNYLRYLQCVGKLEKRILANLINEILNQGTVSSIDDEVKNEFVVYKNPTSREVRDLKAKGLLL